MKNEPEARADGEVWKRLPSASTTYEVSSLGRVRLAVSRNKARVGMILAEQMNQFGYVRVHLSHDGIKRDVFVHRLVLETFVCARPDDKFANHINGVRNDNRLVNLEWVTRSENAFHSIRVLGRKSPIGEESSNAKLTEQGVRSIRARMAAGHSAASLAREYGVCTASIQNVCRRKTWAHVGSDVERSATP